MVWLSYEYCLPIMQIPEVFLQNIFQNSSTRIQTYFEYLIIFIIIDQFISVDLALCGHTVSVSSMKDNNIGEKTEVDIQS